MAWMSTASPANALLVTKQEDKARQSFALSFLCEGALPLSQMRSVSRIWRNPLHCSTTHEGKISQSSLPEVVKLHYQVSGC
jgi:hypothetical protein